ncbi:hypothetical protein [Paenibacillus sp. NFR01]|uniref:hypothetical protein n=1 Tax=Paenibacillus sp. NFR01 TaxID=1566279 RepID=UPI0008CCCDB9|nr:hypothetical protein [Paenibacillus sp. NFR01]SEU26206.1 hypothetical protein SAMN03159358_4472 [Paenibacillus sp. NFR01]
MTVQNGGTGDHWSRQRDIILRLAEKAAGLPLQEGGLWFHDDVRNNFYYASYLFAAAKDTELAVSFDREKAAAAAESVLTQVLLLQNRQPGTPLLGHWPLGLAPVPAAAPPHELPAELMGSLIAYFRREYGGMLSEQTDILLDRALAYVYASGFYRKPMAAFGHHEAKYTAAKLIFGRLFADRELFEDGRACLAATLNYVQENGMPEYGSLPWFWHWVQAYNCALSLVGDADEELRRMLEEMLQYLWRQRALYYVGGGWAGPHCRGLGHDVPGDANVLHDYVQFGDFALPEAMPRTEYAGLLCYPVPEEIRRLALDRGEPVEVKRVIRKAADGRPVQAELHSYAYMTRDYGAGGLWERVEEFDNEQLRWAYSLPVRPGRIVNRLYFFHPGAGYTAGDPRHQSRYMEVLFRRSLTAALFTAPVKGTPAIAPSGSSLPVDTHPVGVLPRGEWLQRPQALFGRVDGVYFAVFLSGGYSCTERDHYTEVTLSAVRGGVVVDAVAVSEAESQGIVSLSAFADAMQAHAPQFTVSGAGLALSTVSRAGERISLSADGTGAFSAQVDGMPVSFEDYTA